MYLLSGGMTGSNTVSVSQLLNIRLPVCMENYLLKPLLSHLQQGSGVTQKKNTRSDTDLEPIQVKIAHLSIVILLGSDPSVKKLRA